MGIYGGGLSACQFATRPKVVPPELRACSAKWCGRHGELAGHGEPKVEMSELLAAYVLGGLFMNVVKRNRELRSVRLTQGDGHVGSAKDGAAPR